MFNADFFILILKERNMIKCFGNLKMHEKNELEEWNT